jgi:competence protein ComEC
MKTAKDAFLLKEWLAADADPRLPADSSLAEGVSCDEAGCVAQLPDGGFVALALRPEALADDCTRAAVIVTAKQASPDCGALVIGQERLQKQSAISLRRTRSGFVIDTVRPNGVDRPWSPTVDDQTEPENSYTRPVPARPVDATPAEADLQAEE